MDEHDKGQVAASAAQVYEQFFVPALFIEWPRQVLQSAGVMSGESVLDVACGTGILAAAANTIAGATGKVAGVDINDGMLAVARVRSPDIVWQQGAAESLPYSDAEFDHVVSQFGLMFFEQQVQSIAEMIRVMKTGGSGCVAVWASLEDTPGYLAVASMLAELMGAEIAKSIEVPYSLGDTTALKKMFDNAGASSVVIETRPGKARFGSIDAWLHTDIKGWTLAEVIDDEGYEQLKHAAPEYLGRFTQADGRVEFDAPAHLVRFMA